MHQAAIDFNLRPALYAAPSWLPVWARARPIVRGSGLERALSEALLRELGLELSWDWQLASPVSRCFAAEAQRRDAVAVVFGALVCRSLLRRGIAREQRAALAQALDEGPMGHFLAVDGDGVPEAEIGLPRAWWRLKAAELRARLHDAGAALLATLFDPSDAAQQASASRSRLMLPRGYRLDIDATPDHRAATQQLLVGTLAALWVTPCKS